MVQIRRSRGRAALMAAAVALGAGLLAAPPAGAAGITLTFANWADAEGATRPGIEAVIAAFEKAHPDIAIRSQAISFTEIARQLVLRVRSGNPPDVAELAGNDTILLALTGRLEPLDRYIDPALRAALKPSALTGLDVKGKLIAFPWTQAPAGLWYNKAIMKKAGLDPARPPATLAELATDMAAIRKTQPDVIPLGIDTTNRPFAMISNWPWMRSFGADPMAEGGKGAAAAPMMQYLAWMRALNRRGDIDPGRKIGEFRPLAAQDKVAFLWDQVLVQGVIQSVNHMTDAQFYAHWGVAPLPAGASGKSYSFDGGHQLVMFAGSEHKKAAWEFIRFLSTSPEAIGQYTLTYESSLTPLTKAPDAALAGKLDTPVFNAFTDRIMPTVVMPPYGPRFAAASTAVMAGVQQAVTGSEPIARIAGSIEENLSRP